MTAELNPQSFYKLARVNGIKTNHILWFAKSLITLADIEETEQTLAALASYNQPVKRYTRSGVLIEPDDASGVMVE